MGLGLRAAARGLKISHVALLKAVKTGRVQKEPDGTFDVDKCRRALVENSNVPKQQAARSPQARNAVLPELGAIKASTSDQPPGTSPPSGAATFLELQRQREGVRLEKDRLDLANKRGELVAVGEINAYVAGMIIRARDIFLRLGPELRDSLARETDPTKCEELVMADVRRGLCELAEYR